MITKNIGPGYDQVKERISDAEQRFGRPDGSVRLVAVSKTRGVEEIAALAALGQQYFAENYLQEAEKKIMQLTSAGLEWHFIGPIQSNKTRQIAGLFQWVHSVDREKIARRLNDARGLLPPLEVCIQVNTSGETSKSGIEPGSVQSLATTLADLGNLRLRGLMAMPAPVDGFAAQRRDFARLRTLYEQLQKEGFALDTLSMGTSNDMEAAIAEGATMIRIGTALFGPRT